jgi:hypothetical protein
MNFVGFFFVSFECSAGKEAVLVVGLLELFRIDVWLFTAPGWERGI